MKSAIVPGAPGFVDASERLRHPSAGPDGPGRCDVGRHGKGKPGMLHRKGSLLLLALAALPGVALAQASPTIRANEIIERFSGADLGKARGLGAERKVCVGTETDCGIPPKPALNAPSFDLMIQFALDSDRLTDAAQRNLDEFAAALKAPQLGTFRFAVEGHTDARGSDSHNLDLSRRRAEAVVGYLEAKGIARDRVRPQAFGSARPRTDNPLDATNRRVETRLAQ